MTTNVTGPALFLIAGVLVFFFFNPHLGALLIAIGALLLVVRLVVTAATPARQKEKTCPACARSVNAEAVVCQHCGKPFPAAN